MCAAQDTIEIWHHALRFLDNLAAEGPAVDRGELFGIVSPTKIFEKDGSNLQTSYKEREKDTVVVFTEIVQAFLKLENERCEEGFNEAFNVHKIEGYHYLNGRLQLK